MKFKVLIYLAFIGSFLSGCYIKEAQPEEHKTLVIASDYLQESDSILFADFSKANNIRVIIKNISTNNLIGEIRNKDYNHGIDLIMMKSMFNVFKLDRVDFFHTIEHLDDKYKDFRPYASKEYNFIGFSIDPYISVGHVDTTAAINNYNDLKNGAFVSALNDDDLITMLAPLMSKFDKVDTYSWIKRFNEQKTNRANISKWQTRRNPNLLINYSDFKLNASEDSVFQKYQEIYFPNSNTTGSFYNLRTFCIAKQAQHFTYATEFIRYYLKPENNVALNKRMRTYPVLSKSSSIKVYRINYEELIQYFTMIERILSRLT